MGGWVGERYYYYYVYSVLYCVEEEKVDHDSSQVSLTH